MHLGRETSGLIGTRYPCGYFVLGYPDVLDPYCARGIVWCGSARSTTMLCPGLFTLRGRLHYGQGPSVLVGLGVGTLHQGKTSRCSDNPVTVACRVVGVVVHSAGVVRKRG